MANLIDKTGERFGRLVLIARAPNKGVKVRWHYICDCGKEGIAMSSDLVAGKQKSCGCLHKEIVSTHKQSQRTTEYRTWVSMKQRCTNPNATHYERYGGRGISVCERWLKFENFFEDMGRKPSRRHTLERIDNNGNYEPSNCRWATRKEQAQNRTHNIKWQHRQRDNAGRFA